MLYLVSTPIGNLKDLTLRAQETLQNVELVLCEDTRHSSHLMRHYDIKTPLKSYHRFNEAKQNEEIIARLANGSQIALISDAGTPGIADPGERLVKECVAQNIPICPIPGPAAFLTALVASGLLTTRFQFVGFLPRKSGALSAILAEAVEYAGTTICYESPERIHKTVQLLAKVDADCQIVIARELTKKFEEFLRGSATELATVLQDQAIRGEIVLLINGDPNKKKCATLESKLAEIETNDSLKPSQIAKNIAKATGLKRRDVYKKMIQPNEI